MTRNAIEFWFECGSTYTYLSVMRAEKVVSDAGLQLEWRPFLLMPILIKQGMEKGPFLPFPKKLDYMWRDLERRAKHHNLAYKRPSVYPPNTLLTARVGFVASHEGWCREFTEGVFRRHWVEQKYIGTDTNLHETLSELGKDPKETLLAAASRANKDALKLQTQIAADLGIFGSPTFVVGKDLFWGDDRLEDAIDWARDI